MVTEVKQEGVESNIEVQSEVNGDASLTEVKQKGVENNIEVQREVNGDESLTEVKQEGVESNVKMKSKGAATLLAVIEVKKDAVESNAKMKSEGAATLLAVNVIKFAPFLSYPKSDFCSAIPIQSPTTLSPKSPISHTFITHMHTVLSS